MKNILNKLLIGLTFVVILSCENEYVPAYESVTKAPLIRFDEILLPVIDFTAIETSAFTNTLVDPGGNTASLELFVSLSKPDSTYDTVALRVITAFPNEVSISAQDVLDAYDGTLTFADFDAGDQLNISSIATDLSGTAFTTADFTGDALNPGIRQALDYTIFFSCPFSAEEAAGDYLITVDWFGGSDRAPNDPITAEVNEDGNIVFRDMFSSPEMSDVVVVVEESTGIATVAKQEAFDTGGITGTDFGIASIEGSGFFFSCTGFLTLDLSVTVAAGGFGTGTFQWQRQ